MSSPSQPMASTARESGSFLAKTRHDEQIVPLDLHSELIRLNDVFVAPPEFEAFCRECAKRNERIISLTGDAGSGRMACALGLASYLAGFEGCWLQPAPGNGNAKVVKLPEDTLHLYLLEDLVRMNLLQPDCVHIVHDPFKSIQGQPSPEDLGLAALFAHLNPLRSWLIVTDGSKSHFKPSFNLNSVAGDDDFLKKVVTNHLEAGREEGVFFPPEVEEFTLTAATKGGTLSTAPRIERFLRAIATDDRLWSTSANSKDWKEIADSLVNESRPRRDWFHGLSLNARFLAMLVGALEGMHRRELEDFYHDQILELRSQRETRNLFHDPRLDSFEELYRDIHVIADKREVRFISESYRQEVIRQMRANHHLLWKVVERAQSWMKHLKEERQWRERMFWGEAIGRLGIHRPKDLRNLLVKLANAEEATIATIPGQVMRGLYLMGSEESDFVWTLLEEWSEYPRESTDARDGRVDGPAGIWSAADAISRIYVELAARTAGDSPDLKRLENLLTRISTCGQRYREERAGPWLEKFRTGDPKWDRKLQERALAEARDEFELAVALAVLSMFQARPAAVARMLLGWLNEQPTSTASTHPVPPAATPDEVEAPAPQGNGTVPTPAPANPHPPEAGEVADSPAPASPVDAEIQPGETGGTGVQDISPIVPDGTQTSGVATGGTSTTVPESDEAPAGEESAATGLPQAPLLPTKLRRTEPTSATTASAIVHRLFRDHRNPDYLTATRTEALLSLVGPVVQSNRTVVDRILVILRDWIVPVRTPLPGRDHPGSTEGERPCQNESRNQEILKALLHACDRISEGQRRGLCRGLMTLWLSSRERAVREIASRVIRRARLLEGVPSDLPEGSWGCILIDDSELARQDETGPRLAREVFELLSPQVDLWMVRMGDGRQKEGIICKPGLNFDSRPMFHPPAPLRLVVPWLERIEREETSPPAFHLAVSWPGLLDAADLVDSEDRLGILTVEGSKTHETGIVADIYSFLGFPRDWIEEKNEKTIEEILVTASREMECRIARDLSSRTADAWWELLLAQGKEVAGRLRELPDRRSSALRLIEEITSGGSSRDFLPVRRHARNSPSPGNASDRDEEEDASQLREDELRLAMGLLQFLAADQLPATVEWLVLKMRSTERGLTGNFANAAATMLLRLHGACHREGKLAGPPPAASHSVLLDLAPALARRRSHIGIRALIEALRHWMDAADWVSTVSADLRAPSTGTSSRLLEMVGSSPPWFRPAIGTLLQRSDRQSEPEPSRKQGPETPTNQPDVMESLSLRLGFEIAMLNGNREWKGTYPLQRPLTLVILACTSQDEACWEKPRTLARQLFARPGEACIPEAQDLIVVEAGSRIPLAVTGESWPGPGDFPPAPQASICVPLLEPLFSGWPRRVILIAGRVPADLADLADLPEAAQEQIFKFWTREGTPPPGDDWTELPSGTGEEVISRSLRFIRDRLQIPRK